MNEEIIGGKYSQTDRVNSSVVVGSIIAAVAAVAAAGITAGSQSSTNKKQAEEAEKNRRFQERMSSTAHQREVADLRAAGINPVFTAMGGSGASTPQGSLAQFENPFKVDGSSATAIWQRVNEKRRLGSDLKVNDAIMQEKKSAAAYNSAAALREKSQVNVNKALQSKLNQEAKESSARESKLIWESGKAKIDYFKDKWIYKGKKGRAIRHLEKLKDVTPNIHFNLR